MYPRRECAQAACPCDRDYTQNRQTDRADGEAREREPGVRARLRAQKRREDQVAAPKNMENSVKPTRIRFLP